jgi:tRNA uridine 5-carboxymethylaminomethyl modification enzyme
MFTSRAEYRLTLRADNADQRLTGKGLAIGCVGSAREEFHRSKMAALEQARQMAHALQTTPDEAEAHGLVLKKDGRRRSAFELLSYPHVTIAGVARLWPQLNSLPRQIAEQLESDAKYAVYLERQAADVASYRRDDGLELPDDLDYRKLPGLSAEMRQKFETVRPRTVGQASRVDGATPAALTLLAAHVRRRRRSKGAAHSA